MHFPSLKPLSIIAMIFTFYIQHAEANTLKITITPRQNLHTGRINDGTEIATIHVSGMRKLCELNIWIDSASQESKPGHYMLTNSIKRSESLIVKLSGDNWQPNTYSGRGIHLMIPEKNSDLRLLAAGEQIISINTWPVTLTAACISPHTSRGL